ncbi:putative lipoprotein [Mycobacterium sp. MAC_080597_8934]|nr:putative lipoprotein [Mycobacterium sp. MAC_080597_8934]
MHGRGRNCTSRRRMPREPTRCADTTQRRRQGPASAEISAVVRGHPSSGPGRHERNHCGSRQSGPLGYVGNTARGLRLRLRKTV